MMTTITEQPSFGSWFMCPMADSGQYSKLVKHSAKFAVLHIIPEQEVVLVLKKAGKWVAKRLFADVVNVSNCSVKNNRIIIILEVAASFKGKPLTEAYYVSTSSGRTRHVEKSVIPLIT